MGWKKSLKLLQRCTLGIQLLLRLRKNFQRDTNGFVHCKFFLFTFHEYPYPHMLTERVDRTAEFQKLTFDKDLKQFWTLMGPD